MTSGSDGERLPLETGPDTSVARRSFFGVPLCEDLDKLDARVAFLGVPYEFRRGAPGARLAPDAIRDAGTLGMANVNGARFYDIDTDRFRLEDVTMADCGDVTIIPGDVERNFWRITRAVRKIVAQNAMLVAVGGDHGITGPIVRGLESFGKVDILHFDAHLDFHDHAQGVRWMNGAPLRRAAEFPWVGQITHVGIRQPFRSRQTVDDARARGNVIVTADQFRALGPEGAIAQMPESDAPLYVTFDIDGMDASVAPGTGGSEPGGLTYLDMRDAFRALGRRGRRIVGMDLVEVCPPLDQAGVTSKIASRLILDFLDAVFP